MKTIKNLTLAGAAISTGVIAGIFAAPLFHTHDDPRAALRPM